jgi:phospholipid/cholesterol/gamma-HCH transport system substrate-binding protein
MPSSRKIAVGAFVVAGLILFSLGLFWIGDRRQLFSESIELYTGFRNVSGLANGAKVRVSGLDAGEVLEIRIPPSPDQPLVVRFRVTSRFRPILRADSVASVQTDGLVGNRFLQVDAGSSQAAPIVSGATIPAREPLEIADLMSRAYDTMQSANETVLQMRGRIDDAVKAMLDLNEEAIGVITEVGGHTRRMANVGVRMVENVDMIVSRVKDGQGTVGRLFNDDQIYNQLRSTTDEAGQAVRNMRDVSADLKQISEDIKERDLSGNVQRVAQGMEELVAEATSAVRSLQEGESGGLMSEVRQTLGSANEAMANLAENTQAIKRNWFFRGFFNSRGFYDLDNVTVSEYQEGRFLPDRQKRREWFPAADIFETVAGGGERLTADGRRRLELAMANFLQYSASDPLIIEGWAGSSNAPEEILKARSRAMMVRDYLLETFQLQPNYVGTLPMNTAPPGTPDDGVALVLFAPRNRR